MFRSTSAGITVCMFRPTSLADAFPLPHEGFSQVARTEVRVHVPVAEDVEQVGFGRVRVVRPVADRILDVVARGIILARRGCARCEHVALLALVSSPPGKHLWVVHPLNLADVCREQQSVEQRYARARRTVAVAVGTGSSLGRVHVRERLERHPGVVVHVIVGPAARLHLFRHVREQQSRRHGEERARVQRAGYVVKQAHELEVLTALEGNLVHVARVVAGAVLVAERRPACA